MEKAEVRDPLYLEDVRVGLRCKTETYRVEEAEIKAFASQYDPQPFHLDDAAAQASVFKGLAASGWHTTAITMRLVVRGGIPFAAGTVGFGAEVEWPRPTRPGDVLHVESEVIEIIPSKSKPNQAIVKVRNVTVNQNGEPVQIMVAKLLVFRRPES
jgi:acyl dehydratase